MLAIQPISQQAENARIALILAMLRLPGLAAAFSGAR